MFENPRRGRQARNFTTNVPKIVDLKLSPEQIFSENCRWVPLIFLSSKKLRKTVACVTNSINEVSVCFTNTLYIITDITFLQDTFRKTAFRWASSIVGFGSIWSRPTLTFKKKCTTALLNNQFDSQQ